MFCIVGQLNANTSLFTYGKNESVDTFRNDSYVPMFLDAINWANNSVKEAAEAECKGNAACLFDAAATNDPSIGLASLKVDNKNKEDTKKLGELYI